MPLIAYECKNGHSWDVLTTIDDPDKDACPECGSTPIRKVMAGTLIPEKDEHDFDPLELMEHLDNKASLEADSLRILSGEVTIREKGPKFLRPVCPEELRKRIF